MDLNIALTSIVAIAALVVPVSEAVAKFLGSLFNRVINGFVAWALTLFVSIIICIGTAYLHVGIFADAAVSTLPTYELGAVVGVVVCLVATGIFSTDAAKRVLTFLNIRVPVEGK